MNSNSEKLTTYEVIVKFLGGKLGDVYRHGADFTMRKGDAIKLPLIVAEELLRDFPDSFRSIRTCLTPKKRPPVHHPVPVIDRVSRANQIVVPPAEAPPKDVSHPEVTLIMPAYNQEKYVKQAIDSILCQTFRNFELVIVDDCSTDKTTKIIKGYNDSRIRYFRMDKNRGTGAALNKGFAEANHSSKYGTWVSSDNIMKPQFIAILLEVMEATPGLVLAYADCDCIAKDETVYPLIVNKNFDRELLYKECYIGVAFLFSMSIKRAVGEYDLRPCEDYDMHLRMVEFGNFARVHHVLGIWRDHKENVTNVVNVPNKWKNHYRVMKEARQRVTKGTSNVSFFKKTAKIKVVCIHPVWDSAGVGIMFKDYMDAKTSIGVRHVMGWKTFLEHDDDLIIWRDREVIKRVLDEADILHFNTFMWERDKEIDMPEFDYAPYLGGKKLIFHLHGGPWSIRTERLRSMIKDGVTIVSCSPPITGIVKGAHWLPNIVPIRDTLYMPVKRKNDLLSFLYLINHTFNKGKDAVDAVFGWLEADGYKFEYESWLRKYKLKECLQKRRRFDVCVDNLTQGFIGMVGWEGMSMEQAVIAWVDEITMKSYTSLGEGKPPPIINVQGIEGLADEIIKLTKNKKYLRKCQVEGRRWMERYYNPDKVCAMWEKFYEEVSNGRA